MGSHFKVSIRYTGKNKDNSNNYTHSNYGTTLKFYPKDILAKRKINIFNTNIPCAQEYHDIFLNFISDDANDRLLIPDLDDYDVKGAQRKPIIDKDGTRRTINYFLPQKEIPLFEQEKKIQPVPLSADIYTIIVESNHHKYYSYFRVISKELNSTEWKIMIKDLEKTSKEMAFEHVHQYHKHVGLTSTEQNDILFAPLLRNYQKIMTYIHLILSNPRYKIAKSYHWVKLGREQFIDQITVRKMNEMPTINGWIYAPHRYLNYDIEDNRWVKFIAIRILERTNLAIRYYRKADNNVNRSLLQRGKHHFYGQYGSELSYEIRHAKLESDTLEQNIKKLSRLRNYLFYVIHNSILKRFHRISGFIPKGLILSPKYNILYRMYLKLNNSHLSNHLAPQIEQYRYKPTSELYEIWTVLQVIKSLEIDGYKGINGWIFDDHSVIPTLKVNQKMIMQGNDNLTLVIVYNKVLSDKSVSRDTSAPFNNGIDPVYISRNHNRPDIRIDVFKDQSKFIGTIALDAKYMKLSSILSFHRKGSVHNQLMDYTDIATNPRFLLFSPVLRVYALYPSKDSKNFSQNYKIYHDYNIHLTRLRPGNMNDLIRFAKDINQVIDIRIERVSRISIINEYMSNSRYRIFYLRMNNDDCYGKALYDGHKMIIKAGSKISSSNRIDFPHYSELKYLINKHVIVNNKFIRDYTFKSPTEAGNIIHRMTINGRAFWKNKDNESINTIYGNS